MSKEQTATILFLINLCLLLAYLGLAWWAPRHVTHDGSRGFPVIRVITVGVAGMLVAQLAMLLISASWTWILWILLAVCVTVGTLAQTSMSLSFPSTLAGRANTAFNLLLFVGAFAVQWGIGLLIDVFTAWGAGPADAMRAAFAVCLACQALSFAVFLVHRAQPRIA